VCANAPLRNKTKLISKRWNKLLHKKLQPIWVAVGGGGVAMKKTLK
jgi:hypothetical protein